jgi:hypothetical protein
MKPIKIFTLMFLLTVMGTVCSFAQGKSFASLEGGYIVELPIGAGLKSGGPLRVAETQGMGASYANRWEIVGANFEAAYIKFDRDKMRLTFKETDQRLEDLAQNIIDTVAAAGVKPARNEQVITNGRHGREIAFKTGAVQMVFRFYPGDGVIVRLYAESDAAVLESTARKFLDSFRLASREEVTALKIREATPPALPQTRPAQWMKPDADELARGKVKDIVEEIENGKAEGDAPARHKKLDYFFDPQGFLTKTVFYAYNSDPDTVTVYGFINGMRVNKNAVAEREAGVLVSEPEGDTPKKRDRRFSTGVVEKYDAGKRVIERAFYDNAGELFLRSIYAYRDDRVEIAEYQKNGTRDNSVSQVLDKQGNLIEKTSQNFVSHPNQLHYSYKYLAFDSNGNWTKRTVSFQAKEPGLPDYATDYTEYRTINYY